MRFFLITSVALVCVACRSSAPKPAPDRAALSVLIRAEPKSGWRDADSQRSAYEPGEVGRSRAYETLNYSAIDDIVVWVEPSDPTSSDIGTERLTIDVGRPSMTMHACGLRDSWTIQNSAPEALPIYASYESGSVVDLGTLAPGGQVTSAPREPGLVLIMTDIRPDPLAQIYVAPVPTSAAGRVQVTQSGTKVVFNNLPPGPARVSCWQPRLPGSGSSVLLTAGATTNATLVVGVDLLPQVP